MRISSFLCNSVLFFFFKQKTAYEMRISDWSSDVCSSDLVAAPAIALVDGAVPVELVIPCRCPGRRLHREFGAGMELVAARARHGVDDTTGAAAELRRIAAGLDLELFVERERNRRIALATVGVGRSEEHPAELQSLTRHSYAVF